MTNPKKPKQISRRRRSAAKRRLNAEAMGDVGPVTVEDEFACVKCGCTDDFACEGGCYWVSHNPPLCSSCV